jgi:hypothetical protein
MAASFSVQPETTSLYSYLANPAGATPAQITTFIDAVYQDLFNRGPDPSGLAYWQNYLASNASNPQAIGAFILNVISGSQGADQTTISNKVTVADYFTQTFASHGGGFGAAAAALAHTAIASVTSSSSSLFAAEASVDAWLSNHPSSSAAVLGIANYQMDGHAAI